MKGRSISHPRRLARGSFTSQRVDPHLSGILYVCAGDHNYRGTPAPDHPGRSAHTQPMTADVPTASPVVFPWSLSPFLDEALDQVEANARRQGVRATMQGQETRRPFKHESSGIQTRKEAPVRGS
jgi:hypothetical protein